MRELCCCEPEGALETTHFFMRITGPGFPAELVNFKGSVGRRPRRYFPGREKRKQGLRGRVGEGRQAKPSSLPSQSARGRLGPRILLRGRVWGVRVCLYRTRPRVLAAVPQLRAGSEGLGASPRAGKRELSREGDKEI